MSLKLVRGIAMIVVGVAFLALAFTRTGSHALWIAVGAIFVILGVRLSRRTSPPPGAPGA